MFEQQLKTTVFTNYNLFILQKSQLIKLISYYNNY